MMRLMMGISPKNPDCIIGLSCKENISNMVLLQKETMFSGADISHCHTAQGK